MRGGQAPAPPSLRSIMSKALHSCGAFRVLIRKRVCNTHHRGGGGVLLCSLVVEFKNALLHQVADVCGEKKKAPILL